MLDLKTNVSCVLESVFAGFKDENIEIATENITKLYVNELENIICELRNCYPSMPIFNKREWEKENKAYLDCESIIFDRISKLKGE